MEDGSGISGVPFQRHRYYQTSLRMHGSGKEGPESEDVKALASLRGASFAHLPCHCHQSLFIQLGPLSQTLSSQFSSFGLRLENLYELAIIVNLEHVLRREKGELALPCWIVLVGKPLSHHT